MNSLSNLPAVLVLEDGRIFRGRSYGAVGTTLGEAVFTTGMTGYQETLTDPSYAHQIIVQTFPHVGNTGVNSQDPESTRMWAAGYVVRDAARRPSNWRSERTLDDDLKEYGIVGIRGVDTRALTRHLREVGALKSGVFSGDAAAKSDAELIEIVKAQPPMAGRNISAEVSVAQAYIVEPADHGYTGAIKHTVAAIDLGMKSMTPHRLAERGLRVHVLPHDATLEDIKATGANGVFFSNGPGDPATATKQVELVRSVLDAGLPYFGICFGNQMLGRALGFDTYKLRFGHRGINQPVMDKSTGRVEITSQNHGFAVDAPIEGSQLAPVERFGKVEVSHYSLNDHVVEGLNCLDIPAFSVQYHPEAASGPHDAAYLFDRFITALDSAAEKDSK
ncbi:MULTISPECIES: glutamine-hydrolyzing carbamoyl-phosphate synthase small subunit [Micrococcaceae]|uniref:glutamine-hydrolyzing carbamoyl-phosphate synthase small subunit n=1 Tax=Micrococcaceae TaxID=1268 RepID=UPI0010357FB8|nr:MULTISPECIES: glutamine-hydrolyzing carbamoyl-phosphate synthase small subunit [Micrococcaceae]TAP27347.1 carbamoyl-phosphate synthase small subunit [Arthrobacter sp. S41]UXN31046.1 glutamine-hydrolyzing carbamoyl-phosphate synthase small subunit [Glutamicibacter sp. M10]